MDAVQATEVRHMEHARQGGGFRILMIDDNIAITPREEEYFIQLYNDGVPIWEIVEKMQRAEKVLVVLWYELAEEGKIEPRPGGVYGKAREIEGKEGRVA